MVKQMSRDLYIGLHSFLFVKFATSSPIICHTFRYKMRFFGSFLFARYALSSQSVRSGRTMSEIFRENVNYFDFFYYFFYFF